MLLFELGFPDYRGVTQSRDGIFEKRCIPDGLTSGFGSFAKLRSPTPFAPTIGGMPKLTKKVKSLFSRRRPVTREDAAEIADWLNEGGALHPDGPPPVVDPRKDKKA